MTTLPTVPLGDTGLSITRVGFGTWVMGGAGWAFSRGVQDDGESVSAIHRATELGINWIDTAPTYGLGHSEEVVGHALSLLPEQDRPYVFTKCGLVWDEGNRLARPSRIASRKSIRYEIDNSLKRLGLERVDLYQLHWPPNDETPIEEYWQTLLELKEEGKAAAVALSNHGVTLLDRAERVGHVSAIQPAFSAINRLAASDVLPWCDRHGTGAVVYSPMQSGLLSGSYSAERVAAMAEDDVRRINPNFRGDALTANLALADALGLIGQRHDVSAGVIAVAWTLSFPGVAGAIVGASRASQVEGWIAAGDLVLSDDELEEIALAIERTHAGDGPTRP